MTVRFVEEAEFEFLDAISYYGRIAPELGRRFSREVDQFIDTLVLHPEIYPVQHRGYQRVNLHLFPYYIAFIVRGDALWILSVSHGNRRPEYWIKRRIKNV